MSIVNWVVLGLAVIGGSGMGWSAEGTPAKSGAEETAVDLAATGLAWREWSPQVFEEAKRDHKLILLHLGAGWCHWCHVMEHVTYRDAGVDAVIKADYVAVHVDQDSRPDLANRYEDYGWPATIIFDAEGKELVKWRGYIPPGPMARMLEATFKDPTPGPSVTGEKGVTYGEVSVLSPEMEGELKGRLEGLYDAKNAGWGTVHKYLDWDALEYEMDRARNGDAAAGKRARETLAQTRLLIDPVWGGMYQYSTDGDWVHPHFEKIMQYQAQGMRIFSMAYGVFHDPKDLAAAESIARFVERFLRSQEGAFYTSQDADVVRGEESGRYFAMDDAGRRKIGVPLVDTHVYARENGWAITGLVALFDASGERRYLVEAEAAERWVVGKRGLPGGGFRHDQEDATGVAGPYLGDTLAMGEAELVLYRATMDRQFVKKAEAAAEFIEGHFRGTGEAGYVTAAGSAMGAVREFDENVGVARLGNFLYQYTGMTGEREMAERAMRLVATPEAAARQAPAGTLLAGYELGRDPLHVTVMAKAGDADGAALYAAALAAGVGYVRVERFDPTAGAALRTDVLYPLGTRAAAYVCSASACSAPLTTVAKLTAALEGR